MSGKIKMSLPQKAGIVSSETRYALRHKMPFLSEHPKSYHGKKIMSDEQGTEELLRGLNTGKPYLAGRFGMVECAAARKYFHRQAVGGGYNENLRQMCNNAGFFPEKEEYLDRYVETVIPLYKQVDLLCCMYAAGEDFIVKHYCPNAKLSTLRALEPSTSQWTSALEGRKVLVVHPFEESISNQYNKNRENIYAGTNILPKFDLRTVKAVQTSAGTVDPRFADWFEALNYMFEESMKKDFDIALIGCGSYGLPLGAMLKQQGKQVVHMGGCLQLLFGIMGSRWEDRDFLRPYINDSWVRPLESEKPKDAQRVENACYW